MIGNTAKRLQTDYIEYPLAGIRHDFCRKQPSFAKLCIQRYHLTCIGSFLENIFKRNEIAEVHAHFIKLTDLLTDNLISRLVDKIGHNTFLYTRFHSHLPIYKILHKEIGQNRRYNFDPLLRQPAYNILLGKRIKLQENLAYDSNFRAMHIATNLIKAIGSNRQYVKLILT